MKKIFRTILAMAFVGLCSLLMGLFISLSFPLWGIYCCFVGTKKAGTWREIKSTCREIAEDITMMFKEALKS